MIRALIFDCFGVLYHDRASLLYEVAPEEKHDDLRNIIKAGDYGYITRDEYYSQIAELVGVDEQKIREINARQYTRNVELFDRIRELKKQYKVAVLSNVSDTLLNDLFTQEEQADFFDVFIQSWQEHIIKPAVEIFQITAERLGVDPSECVMIDDVAANVEGARLAGMQGIQFVTVQQFERELDRILETNARVA
jgi:putative hydrolase of the HAD superfamily